MRLSSSVEYGIAMSVKGCPIINAPVLVGFLGAYNLGVATPRAMVHAGDKTSGNAKSWHMIRGDAKCVVIKSVAFMAKNVAKLIATNTLHNEQLAASTAKLKLINKKLTIANAQLLATISKTKAKFLITSSPVTNIENVTTQNTTTIVKVTTTITTN
ncbi:hypothetical protein Tco_0271654 [Tanacetum coccineum]